MPFPAVIFGETAFEETPILGETALFAETPFPDTPSLGETAVFPAAGILGDETPFRRESSFDPREIGGREAESAGDSARRLDGWFPREYELVCTYRGAGRFAAASDFHVSSSCTRQLIR